MNELLYNPDRNTIEVKALEQAASAAGLSTAHLLEKCGAIPSTRDYHLNRFLLEHFPRGQGLRRQSPAGPAPTDLPLAPAEAFSIDDVTTTEIDDAFSVTPAAGGRLGDRHPHRRAGARDRARTRRSTARRRAAVHGLHAGRQDHHAAGGGRRAVHAGRGPQRVRRCRCTWTWGRTCACAGRAARVERVRIAANLRHDVLEAQFNEETIAAEQRAFPYRRRAARAVGPGRSAGGRARPARAGSAALQMDYNFYVEDERVRIVARRRGSPIDKVVSEMMIFVNSEWGRLLAEAGVPAIYRAQNNGKVRMSTVPAAHQGLGVAQYIWASSPLRRYVDLINQRQLIAWVRGETPPYPPKSERMLTAMRDFELAYEIYGEFQRSMERYWCLRWLVQEAVTTTVGRSDSRKSGEDRRYPADHQGARPARPASPARGSTWRSPISICSS